MITNPNKRCAHAITQMHVPLRGFANVLLHIRLDTGLIVARGRVRV